MATTSSQDIIALPQGGGALHGLGETFSPDLHTGTANFQIPFALPPGRNGFQPQFALSYSSGQANGPFGLGWQLSIPGVSRKTAQGIPIYDDTRDTFILSGQEDLVPIGQAAPNVTRYRPKTEGAFARIDHDTSAGNNYWRVQNKDGLVSYYGTPGIIGPATIADPAHPAHICAWKLSSTADPFGNRVTYTYVRDTQTSSGPHAWDQLYLDSISYIENDLGADLVQIHFDYETRPDPFSEYRSGFEIRTVRRCQRMMITVNQMLARTYEMTYQQTYHKLSLLKQILVTGYDGATSEALPSLLFSYNDFAPQQRQFTLVSGPDLPRDNLDQPQYATVDLFGCGLSDIIEMDGAVRYWRNLGNGRFDRARLMENAPAGLSLSDPGVQFIDANGDGRCDLMVTSGALSGYYPLSQSGSWDQRSFQRYALAPSFDLKDPEVRLIDLNGDGVTDALRSGSRMECYFNDPTQGWQSVREVERQNLALFPDISFSDQRIKLADMTGDGLQDIVLLAQGQISYWPNLGYGNWGARIVMSGSPRFPEGYEPRHILLGDVDGDGVADLVYVGNGTTSLWLNQCGNGWSDAITVRGTPQMTSENSVRLLDLCGSGVSGILWSGLNANSSRQALAFLDFTGGVKPYLLTTMDNQCGSITNVFYAPSTRYYLADAGQAETSWQTTLPFPVQVVARTESIDVFSNNKLVTEYSYHHGYWDGAEREFRGFGRVEQRDSNDFTAYHAPGATSFADVPAELFSPPTVTRTWFHQGPVGDATGNWSEADFSAEYFPEIWPGGDSTTTVFSRPTEMTVWLQTLPRRTQRDAIRALRGKVLRTELYAQDGSALAARPYTIKEQLHTVMPAPPDPSIAGSTGMGTVFFSSTIAERTTQWERGDDPLTNLKFTADFDQYGQPRQNTSIAVPRGRNFRIAASSDEPYLVTSQTLTYARPASGPGQPFIVDRVASATNWEILNSGEQSYQDLWQDILTGNANRHVIEQTLNYYDGAAFTGLPLGQIGRYGALACSQHLVLTSELVTAAYASQIPPYLIPGVATAWSAEYPPEFRVLLPLAGYIYHPADGTVVEGFFATTELRHYDFHDAADGTGRGLIVAKKDPLGNVTTIAYDAYALLPATVTDPAGLVTAASYDYRVLLPASVTEPNGTQSLFSYSPLGLLISTALVGKQGDGDTPSTPSKRMVYDFLAYAQRGQPMSVRTIQRLYHSTDITIPAVQRDQTLESITYSDGLGRVLQMRTQAEDILFASIDPFMGDAGLPSDQNQNGDATGSARVQSGPLNVTVSGWQSYDNKGRVVERFEPFFSTGWDYQPATDAQRGRKITMYYDPRGQVVRTINTDGSEQRVIYGVPQDISDPDHATPTPWELYTYDANDNAGRTPSVSDAALVDPSHVNTPTSAIKDALGRTVLTVSRASRDQHDWYRQHQSYDIRGNLIEATDALGRQVQRHVYDLANRRIRSEQLDGGTRVEVFDAAGNMVEQRDSKGALRLHTFDVLKRLSLILARDSDQAPATLREHIVYGDGGDPSQAAAERQQQASANRLGRVYQHYDEAGLLTVAAYDWKGNVLQKSRQVISDGALMAVFTQASTNGWVVPAFVVDWRTPPELDTVHSQQVNYVYDALNRVIQLTGPTDVAGNHHTIAPQYNNAGLLEALAIDNTPYIEHIAYTAHGQRTLVAYGNGLMTRSAYHPQTARLLRLRTDTFTQPDALTYHPGAVAYQDLSYSYDLVGNITMTVDRAPGSGVRNNPESQAVDSTLARLLVSGDALVRHFSYDPLYRLLSASGRECQNIPSPRPWGDDPRCGYNTGIATPDNTPDLTAIYQEGYSYDPAGNLLSIRHETNSGAWVRAFGFGGFTPDDWNQAWQAQLGNDWSNAPGNQLTNAGTDGPTHVYDPCGNLLQETTSRHFSWDYVNRLRSFAVQIGNAEPSQYTLYLYDSHGQRLKKLTRMQGGKYEVTIDCEGQFAYQYLGDGSFANSTVWLQDGPQRLARVRIGPAFADDASPAILYYLGDHLGSITVVVDDKGSWINREEYSPFGETLCGSFARKRYRFTGKERDVESGLYYHGARYYMPWLGRWASADPAGAVDGLNLYTYVRNNPIKHIDNSGHSAAEKLTDPEVIETAKTALRLIPGGLAAGAGATGAGAGAAGAGATGGTAVAGAPIIIGVAAVISVGVSGYLLYQLHKETQEVEHARQRVQETHQKLEKAVQEAVQQKRMTPEQARLLLSNGLPSTTELTRASARNDSGQRQAFMASALTTILAGCNGKPHPLASLVDAKTRDWEGRSHLNEEPTVQAGHDVSAHSGLPANLAIEDSFFNQLTNWTGEKSSVRAVFEKPSIDICGVRVELRTAYMYARTIPEVGEWFKANNIPFPQSGFQDLFPKNTSTK